MSDEWMGVNGGFNFMLSVLVYGILEGEDQPAVHEAFHDHKSWRSVRTWETGFSGGKNPEITGVTHWMFMPDPPTEK